MNKALKAALLSALIFPGVGHISINDKKKGWFIVFFNLTLVYLIISGVIDKAYAVIAQMQSSGQALDPELVSQSVMGADSFSDNLYLNSLFIIFIASWVYSIFDAYRRADKK